MCKSVPQIPADFTALMSKKYRQGWNGILPLIKISCPFGSGTGIVTREYSLIFVYLIAFISFGITYLADVPLVGPFSFEGILDSREFGIGKGRRLQVDCYECAIFILNRSTYI